MASAHRRNATNYALDISEEREREREIWMTTASIHPSIHVPEEGSNMLCMHIGSFHCDETRRRFRGYMLRFDPLVWVPFSCHVGRNDCDGCYRRRSRPGQVRCMHVARPQLQKGSPRELSDPRQIIVCVHACMHAPHLAMI